MIRLRSLARGVSLFAVLVSAGAAFSAPFPVTRAASDAGPVVVTIGSVAEQLGVKVSSRADNEFGIGVQFTGSLEDPRKLEAVGIKGMNAGARVTAARLSQDRVHVEADELNPPNRVVMRLRLDPDGKLTQAPKV